VRYGSEQGGRQRALPFKRKGGEHGPCAFDSESGLPEAWQAVPPRDAIDESSQA